MAAAVLRRARGGGVSALRTTSTVQALAQALRGRILDRELGPSTRLREAELAARYDVARHTVRAALRVLEADGLVRIQPNRGALVVDLSTDDIRDLHALRVVLEGGAARIALERGDGRLPPWLHGAAAELVALCRRDPAPPWPEAVAAHAALHGRLVAASASPRLVRAYASLLAELQLVLVGVQPRVPLHVLADDHATLMGDLEARGPVVIEEHIARSTTLWPAARPPYPGAP